MVKKILGVLMVCAVVLLGASQLGYFVRPLDTDGAKLHIDTYHSLPEQTMEVLVFGSSHAFKGVNMTEMYNAFGIGGYNYGTNWQEINTTRLFLEDALMTQTPKVALIEMFKVNDIIINEEVGPQVYYSRYIRNKEALGRYLNQCLGGDPKKYLSYYFPLYRFHDNWSSLKEDSFQPIDTPEDNRRYINNFGYLRTRACEEVEIPDPAGFKQKKISAKCIAELDAMVALCHEKGIEVILFTVPFGREYKYGDFLTQYAAENNCVYLDLFREIDAVGLDGKTDFQDAGHLNTSGATKVAHYLGAYISEHYEMTDMRTISGNYWETELKKSDELAGL